MIDRRIPGEQYRLAHEQLSYPSDNTRDTGKFYTRVCYGIYGEPTSARIAHINKRMSKLLSGDYLKERPQITRLVGGILALFVSEKVTHNTDIIVGSLLGTIALGEIPVIRDFIKEEKQEKAKKAILDDPSTLRFRNDGIALSAPLEKLPSDIDFTNIETGATEFCPATTLIESLHDIPGLGFEHLDDGVVNGVLSSGRLVGFMLDRLVDDRQHNKFVSINYAELEKLSAGSANIPEAKIPAFDAIRAEIGTDMLKISLGLYSSFLALQRESVAAQLTDYNCSLANPSAQLEADTELLRDMSTPLPLSLVNAYSSNIPR